MSELNGFCDLLQIAGGLHGRQWAGANQLSQILAWNKIHREKMVAVVDAHFVDRDDIGVIQCGGGGCLCSKAMNKLATRQMTAKNQLQSNNAVETSLTCTIDDSHTTAGNFIEQFVVPEHLFQKGILRARSFLIIQDRRTS